MNVEVVAAFGDLASQRQCSKHRKRVPIVAMADDILGAEIVTSLSRPGGNTTGVTVMAPELSQKRLELLKRDSSRITAMPAVTLWDPSSTGASRVVCQPNALREH